MEKPRASTSAPEILLSIGFACALFFTGCGGANPPEETARTEDLQPSMADPTIALPGTRAPGTALPLASSSAPPPSPSPTTGAMAPEEACASTHFNMEALGSIAILEGAIDLQHQSGYAYATDRGGLWSFDLSDPGRPRKLGSLSHHGLGLLIVDGNLIYVSSSTESWNGLLIVDVSDPAKPVEIGRVEIPERPIALDHYGGRAYIRGEDGTLWSIDASEPSSPQLATSYDPPGRTLSGEIYGNLVSIARRQLIEGRIPSYARVLWFGYLADLDGGLRWVNLHPDDTEEIGGWEDLNRAAHVALTARRVYVFSITQDQSYGERDLSEFRLDYRGADTDVDIAGLGRISIPDQISAETVCRFVDDFYDLLAPFPLDPISHAGARPAEIGSFLQGAVATGDLLMLVSEDGVLAIYDMGPAQKTFTYSSEPGLFTIDYPNGFILYENESPSVDGVIAEAPDTTSILGRIRDGETFLLRIHHQRAGAGEDFEAFVIDDLGGCAGMIDAFHIEAAGGRALLFPDTLCGARGLVSYIYLQRGDLLYRISVESSSSYADIEDSISMLLAGFRPLE